MKLKIFVILLALASYAEAQTLSDFYRKGLIQLQPSSDFSLKGWHTSLENPTTTLPKYKKIAIAKDGSIFVNMYDKHEIWKFDSNGNFIKKFGSHGGKPGQFVYEPNVEGILDGKYLITSGVDGKINFFDLNGNYIKTIKLDYMPLSITPLKNGKFAIIGFTVGKGFNWDILRIIDFNTASQKEIWREEVSSGGSNAPLLLKFPDNKGMMSMGIPYSHPMATGYRIATSNKGDLITASPKTGEVTIYSSEGIKTNTFKLNIAPIVISDADINEQYERQVKYEKEFEEKYVNSGSSKWTDAQKAEIIASYKSQLKNFKDRKYYPERLPFFSSLIVDSDGNLLVFEYTKDETPANSFRAYSYDLKGNLIGTSSFKSENPDIAYAPSTFLFSKGYVFAVIRNSKKPEILKLKLM